jgi:hypothetical protein
MAKKKSKKKAPRRSATHKMDLKKTIHVVVPDKMMDDLTDDHLKSLAHVVAHGHELGLGKPPHAAVEHVQFFKSSEVQLEGGEGTWQKSIPQGC